MQKITTADRWTATLARQLADSASSDADVERAAGAMKQQLPPELHATVDAIVAACAATTTDARDGLSQMLADAEPGARLSALRAFESGRQIAAPALTAGLERFTSAATYTGTLSGIALLIALVVGNYVMPSFAWLFMGFGNDLPAFSRLLFSAGGPTLLLDLLLLILAAMTIAAFFVGWRLRRAVMLFAAPDLGPLARIPQFRRMVEAWEYFLLLANVHALRASGRSWAEALERALKRVSIRVPMAVGGATCRDPDVARQLDALALARDMGTLERELERQCGALADMTVLMNLQRAQDAALAIMRAFVYTVAALIVVAVYMPIFKLGALV